MKRFIFHFTHKTVRVSPNFSGLYDSKKSQSLFTLVSAESIFNSKIIGEQMFYNLKPETNPLPINCSVGREVYSIPQNLDSQIMVDETEMIMTEFLFQSEVILRLYHLQQARSSRLVKEFIQELFK